MHLEKLPKTSPRRERPILLVQSQTWTTIVAVSVIRCAVLEKGKLAFLGRHPIRQPIRYLKQHCRTPWPTPILSQHRPRSDRDASIPNGFGSKMAVAWLPNGLLQGIRLPLFFDLRCDQAGVEHLDIQFSIP